MDRALHQQLLVSVEDNFARLLHRQHLGYRGPSTLDLLYYLYTTYAVIKNTGWIANDKHFREAYAPTDPIEVV